MVIDSYDEQQKNYYKILSYLCYLITKLTKKPLLKIILTVFSFIFSTLHQFCTP